MRYITQGGGPCTLSISVNGQAGITSYRLAQPSINWMEAYAIVAVPAGTSSADVVGTVVCQRAYLTSAVFDYVVDEVTLTLRD